MEDYIENIPDDELTLREPEIEELIFLYVKSIGYRTSTPVIERVSRRPNRLPSLLFIKKKIFERRR